MAGSPNTTHRPLSLILCNMMSTEHQYCIIMAGGAGRRFWPVSRERLPKQFITIREMGTSFLRHTFDRFSKVVPADHIIVITTKRYVQLVKEHLGRNKV